jgi:hypothetical protein
MIPTSATAPCVPTCTGLADCSCGCCAGTSVQTPQRVDNPRGLPAVSSRIGTWSSFKQSMLARLSSSDYPALQALKSRDDDDFTIAFLDASAVMLDVLTFYQERLGNESYLRTAGQMRSLTELSRLIGYQPAPGVSASTYLAFSLTQAPGQTPDPAAPPVVIPAGTKVQSVPPQGQSPQTFETAADIKAKPDWSALKVQTGSPWQPQTGDQAVYLAGAATQLQPGDLFLIVGDERATQNKNSNNWDIRIVSTVTADGANNRTYVTWEEPLGDASVAPAQSNPKFFAFRQRAALFGYNAINLNLLDRTNLNIDTSLLNADGKEWNFFGSQTTANKNLDTKNIIDLDSSYPKIVPSGWVALIEPDQQITRKPPGFVSLYLVKTVATVSRADFGLSAKISRVVADTNTNLHQYYAATRDTIALAQSEQLDVPEQPLTYPLYGASVTLAKRRTDLVGVQAVALSGKRQKIKLRDGVTPPQFKSLDGSSQWALQPGEVLTLTEPPALTADASGWSASANATFNVEDSRGRLGTVAAAPRDFMLTPSSRDDPDVSEYALVSGIDNTSLAGYTQLLLKSALTYCYDRASTAVNANVARATHGQSVSELLGSGDASTPNQSFTLKQSPLTYTQAATPSGRTTSLEVKVNGVTWTAVASLYKQPPWQTVYASQDQPDGTARTLFGDGVEGALLPTGQNNVQATYRIGSGLAGNVGAGTLTTLMDRPLGVTGVSNPQGATGGQDPQSVDDIRANAPQTVLTLGRAVSIADYENFARSFAGIAKAHALWIPDGPGRGVFLTVAGAGGTALPPGDPTLVNLVTSLRNYGNPLIPITAVSFVETLFRFAADVLYDPAYDPGAVEAEVRSLLAQTFGFAARAFGSAVGVDEISTVIQSVAGVIAVNVKALTRGVSSTGGDLAGLGGYANVSVLNAWIAQGISLNRPFADPPGRLCAFLPVADRLAAPQPAELLVLDPDPRVILLGPLS